MRNSILVFLLFFSVNVFSQTVYSTPSGSKYHLGSCRSVKNVSSKTTVEKALKSGLLPCKICNPPRSQVGLGTRSQPAKKTAGIRASSVRCKGLTKSGKRCKHFTKMGNGYCHQHQP